MPRKVRIYERHGYHVLQWWDRQAQKTVSRRVDGDQLDAFVQARNIDQCLLEGPWPRHTPRRLTHRQLIDRYMGHLTQRADAGQISLRTPDRYQSALSHYEVFVTEYLAPTDYPLPTMVDQDFALRFVVFLQNRRVSANGHPNTSARPMRDPGYVLDVTRAMYAWASDPRRGGLLPPEFINPFMGDAVRLRSPAQDMHGEPDITANMAAQFVAACDDHQREVFLPMILYGLRASEPIMLFREHIDEQWVKVECFPDLDYATKGRRNKRLPMLACIRHVWGWEPGTHGLVLVRRPVHEEREVAPLRGASCVELIETYRRRLGSQVLTARQRQKIRDGVIRDAGGLDYDCIQREFRRVARRLKWPATATIKDFRHLFSTAMANGGVPEHERRYLMGHAPGRDAIVGYTHLNRLAQHYLQAVHRELGVVLDALCDQ